MIIEKVFRQGERSFVDREREDQENKLQHREPKNNFKLKERKV